MNPILPGEELYSLKGQYDFDKVISCLNGTFTRNIKFGLMISKLIQQFPKQMVSKCASQLIDEYINGKHGRPGKNGTFEKWDAEKMDHIVWTLKYLQKGKYNFYERNLKEAHQLNDYYAEQGKQKLIKGLPELNKKFLCQYCNYSRFMDKSSLGSHQKACLKKQKLDQSKISTNTQIALDFLNASTLEIQNQSIRDFNGAKQNQSRGQSQKANQQQVQEYKVNGLKRTKTFLDNQEIFDEDDN